MQLFFFKVGKQAVHQGFEAVSRFGIQKVVATGRLGCQAQTGQAKAVLQEPLVDVLAHGGELRTGLWRIGRNDEEFARRVGDLAGRRQCQCVQHLECSQFSEQRHLERATTQQAGGIFAGLAAVGKDEVLNAEKVTLNQQEFVGVPVAAVFQLGCGCGISEAFCLVPAPQGYCQRGGGFAVVVKRNLRFGAKGRGRWDGMGEGEPSGVEVVQPQWPVGAV